LTKQYAEHRIDHSRRARLSADDRRIAMPESAKRLNSGSFEAFNRVSPKNVAPDYSNSSPLKKSAQPFPSFCK
jgi:hypothetical protein